MEKFFLPLVLAVLLLSTIAAEGLGQDFIQKNQDASICAKSRSCALNYVNRLEQEDKE